MGPQRSFTDQMAPLPLPNYPSMLPQTGQHRFGYSEHLYLRIRNHMKGSAAPIKDQHVLIVQPSDVAQHLVALFRIIFDALR